MGTHNFEMEDIEFLYNTDDSVKCIIYEECNKSLTCKLPPLLHVTTMSLLIYTELYMDNFITIYQVYLYNINQVIWNFFKTIDRNFWPNYSVDETQKEQNSIKNSAEETPTGVQKGGLDGYNNMYCSF